MHSQCILQVKFRFVSKIIKGGHTEKHWLILKIPNKKDQTLIIILNKIANQFLKCAPRNINIHNQQQEGISNTFYPQQEDRTNTYNPLQKVRTNTYNQSSTKK